MIALDCTFRDGGYYNDWEFDIRLANDYLLAMERAGIDAIELGFRAPYNSTKNDFSNVTEDFIERNLYIPTVYHSGVMVDTNKMNSEIIKKSFVSEDKSFINFVRAATHFKDVDLAEEVCKELKHLGYLVCCNLMQAASRSFDEIKHAAEKIEKWKAVDVLYFADSLGGMNHDDVNYAYQAIKAGWSGLVGFHGHNNKSQSLSNSLESVDIGVDWVDGTVLGMGRGAGNTETEYLLNELNKRGYGEFKVDPIYEFAFGDLLAMKNRYCWGPALPYYLAAEYEIHPTYIQKLLTGFYPMGRILKAINYLKDKDSSSFNQTLLEDSIE